MCNKCADKTPNDRLELEGILLAEHVRSRFTFTFHLDMLL